MNGFWSWWVAVLTIANVAVLLWLFLGSERRKPGEQRPGAETTGHVWDGDLREYNNPLPRWWLFVFYFTVAFAVVYLVLFPGLAVFHGTLGWSQASQWQEQTDQANALTAREFARFDNVPLADLARDSAALKIGKNLFGANCSTCHGSDARGAKGFPNLTSPNLTWGREPEQVLATISGGRQGVMPAWKDVLGADGIEAVANYVYSLSGRPAPEAALVAAGQEKFATLCVACHGPDGKGSIALGAPNLTDTIWIYGGSLADIKETISNGRSNRMPAHLELLGEQKVRLLAAFVLSLAPIPAAAGEAPAAAPPDPNGSGT
ncbi:MAG TPA: cytochrome-c oxidase, cbb3-type subunit III [Steroidobacteraceae bacterium]|nr:cytochrome-c oxidase, cbb3-type subunit III [Steroidobacteraceae bacterium]